MPYYVFAVKPFAQLERLAEFTAFKDASAHAKALRAAQPPGAVVLGLRARPCDPAVTAVKSAAR